MLWIYYLSCIFILSVNAPFLYRAIKNLYAQFIALFLIAGLYILKITTEVGHIKWASDFGLDLNFRLDGLSRLFTAIILIVGSCVFWFSGYYFKKNQRTGRFYLYFTLFIASMLGLVTADNFYLMFIFWELTSITSYLLIGYYHEKESSRRSALQALLVTGSGGLCLLAALILIQLKTGFTELSSLSNYFSLNSTNGMAWVVILLLLAGFTKSAQAPFHFWLPNAMSAPAPVSALLHSATMVKAGIYLFLRFDPYFNDYPIWKILLIFTGTVTLLIGALSSYNKKDLKQILAYTTIGTLGALTTLIGYSSEYAFSVALLLFVAHAFYKATLFMVAGIIEHKTESRDILQLSGLRKNMPAIFIASTLAALSMIGIPPFLGFLSKETILKVALEYILFVPIWVVGLSFLGAAAWNAGVKPFLGKSTMQYGKVHVLFAVGPLILAVLGLFSGFDMAGILEESIKVSLTDNHKFIPFKLWTGFNVPLLLSVLVIILVIPLVQFHEKYIAQFCRRSEEPFADRFFWLSFALFMKRAKRVTRRIQNGEIFYYLLTIFLGIITGVIYLIYKKEYLEFAPFVINRLPGINHVIIFLVALVGCYIVVTAKTKMTAIVANGCIGFSVAAMFAMLGAPDVAITQLTVEILSVILFVFLLKESFSLDYKKKEFSQFFRVLVSASMGLIISFLTWNAYQQRIAAPISDFFGENSFIKAYGKNVVNVILVDFRGFDTFGEIVVFAVTAVSLAVLMKWKRPENIENPLSRGKNE